MKRMIVILAMASMACLTQVTPAMPTKVPTTTLAPAAVPTNTPELITQDDPIRLPPTLEIHTYTVIANKLYIRDRDGEVAGYLDQGEMVTCMPADSGWCILDHGQRVWSGCLAPNPKDLGCEAR